MYSIEIEKNYFSDELHDLPVLVQLATQEEFEASTKAYRESLELISYDKFRLEEILHDNGRTFCLLPIKVPTKFLRHSLEFQINNEHHLEDFWEYFVDKNREAFYPPTFKYLVSVIYGLVSYSLSDQGVNIKILCRETDYAYVVNVSGNHLFEEVSIKDYIGSKQNVKYFLNGPYYTFFCSKDISELCEEILLEDDKDDSLLMTSTDNHSRVSFKNKLQSADLHLYDFLDYYEVDELIELLSELNSMILVLTSPSSIFSDYESDLLVHYFKSISKILNSSHESFAIGMHIDNVAQSIYLHKELFFDKSQDMATLCGSFAHDISEWVKKLFFEGAPSLHFLDDSIISNCQTIVAMLTQEESSESDIDDIFDF